MKPCLILLMPTTSYRAGDFMLAADRLGVEVIAGTDRCPVLAELGAVTTARESLVLDFADAEDCVRRISDLARERPVRAVLPLDDQTTVLAALAAKRLGLPHNDPRGARATRDKLRLRLALVRRNVRQPEFARISLSRDPRSAAERAERKIGFPCVLKPRMLSASRGVIRVDDRPSFIDAFERLRRILDDPEVRAKGGQLARSILVEAFVPGFEVALEGILVRGRLLPLAIFDKPDPLDGPFFEETLYVTPSRLAPLIQEEIVSTSERAARALGLSEGPIHAELRVCEPAVVLIEIAARSIGGLCSRALRFGLGATLEEVIIRQACGLDDGFDPSPRPTPMASGVLMLPIPRTGTLKEVRGIDEARRVAGIEDVVITAKLGHRIAALPDGNTYLGFAFARGATPELVESALRRAQACLVPEITPELPTLK